MTTTRSPRDVLDEILPAGDPVVVDVGCGDGSLVRHLARHGAHVIGVEVGAEPLARARAHEPVADERYEQAGVDQIQFLMATESVPHDKVMKSIRMFGEHIIPEISTW